jgi:hypothetical protein
VASKAGRNFLGAAARQASLAPPASAFTARERRLIERLRTPLEVQRFLNDLPYNREEFQETLRSFRSVIAEGTVHCLEAAITAAAILEQHHYPPLLLSLESVDLLDHVLFLFRQDGRWGTVARSRDAGLHGRKPMFRSVRELVLTYVEPYVDFTGRLKGYGVGHLYDLGAYDWRFSLRNVWKVERYLLGLPHIRYRMSDRRYRQALKRYTSFRARHPVGPVAYYDTKALWLE